MNPLEGNTAYEEKMHSPILFITDLHVKIANFSKLRGLRGFLETWFLENSVSCIVVGGDTLDTHEKVCVHALNEAIEFIRFLSHHGHVYILVGNHDYINNGQFLTTCHWLNVLKGWPGITVVDSAVVRPIEDAAVVFVPYVPPGRFAEALATANCSPDLIFAHQEFRGCKMGCIASHVGDPWDEEMPPVVSGHIHERQRVGNVVYPGSSVCHSAGYASYGPCLVDPRTGEVSYLGYETRLKTTEILAPTFDASKVDPRDKLKIVGTGVDVALMKGNPLLHPALKRGKFAVSDIVMEDTWRTHILRNLKTKAMKSDFEEISRAVT